MSTRLALLIVGAAALLVAAIEEPAHSYPRADNPDTRCHCILDEDD